MTEKYMPADLKVYNNIPVTKLAMKDLWPSVPTAETSKPNFFKTLMEMIEKDGMKNPLVTVDSTVGEAWGKKKKHGKQVNDPPGSQNAAESNPPHDQQLYVIWGGSNRYAVLERLGYTHVDCVVVPNYDVAFKLQGQQRNSFGQLHRLR
jgi:hypothetical protein